VWCAKYRRRIVGGRVAARAGDLVDQVGDEHGWEVVAKDVMPDHVGPLVRVWPSDAPAAVVRAVTGRSARVLRRGFPYLRNRAKVVSSPSCFVGSVGDVSASTVRRYIEYQWDAVRAS
jgi:putative transposase